MTRIVGIVLVQNEENFVAWAIGNVIEFCDEIIVLDNMSTDGTWARIEALVAQHPGIRAERVTRADRTNAYLQEYIGKDVWVLGVDGDEIYDRDGLAQLRQRLLAGEFDDSWRIRGHTMHATVLDFDAGRAQGYLTPAVAAATKLYNFAHIAEWTPDRQRLHGSPTLKPGFESKRRWLAEETDWDHCDFRNIHLCFFPRSSVDPEVTMRRNITDKFLKNTWRRSISDLLAKWGGGRLRAYFARRSMLVKHRYMGGDLVEVALPASLGRPTEQQVGDAGAVGSEAIIASVSRSRKAAPDLRSERDLRYGRFSNGR